jgi:hypothetical protein
MPEGQSTVRARIMYFEPGFRDKIKNPFSHEATELTKKGLNPEYSILNFFVPTCLRERSGSGSVFLLGGPRLASLTFPMHVERGPLFFCVRDDR